MTKVKENIESMGKFELVVPAKGLLDALIDSADALSKQPIDEERARNLKLVLGFLNAYIKSFQTKLGYFRLTGIPEKMKSVKKYSKRL